MAFLVEAADDICYSIVDIEDGFRMGYISFEEAKNLLNEIAQIANLEKSIDTRAEKIKSLRAKAINNLVEEAVKTFLAREQSLLDGKYDRGLLTQSIYAESLQEITQVSHASIFQHPDVVGIKIAGYEVLGKLFTEFLNAILYDSKKGRLILHLLPQEYHPHDHDDIYHKILKITDYISGMTDSYATSVFQQISGISLR